MLRFVVGKGAFVFASALASCAVGAVETARTPYADARLFSTDERAVVYSGEHLGAIRFPVGGIATGAIHLDGAGVRTSWTMLGRYYVPVQPPDKPSIMVPDANGDSTDGGSPAASPAPTYLSYVPDSFCAVRLRHGNAPAVVRVLQTVGEGAFAPFAGLEFHGEYPCAAYRFEDSTLPADIALEAFNPLIPLNVKDSSIPCAVINVTVSNRGGETLEVGVMNTQQNAVGYQGTKRTIDGTHGGGSGGNVNVCVREAGVRYVSMAGASRTTLALAVCGDGVGVTDVTATADWRDTAALHGDFSADGRLEGSERTGPTPSGETANAAVAAAFTLAPGSARTITFVVAWHVPDVEFGNANPESKVARMTGGWWGEGNYYERWWPDAMSVARYVVANRERLTRETRLYRDTLYESTIPRYALDRVASQVVPIRTRTVWWDRAGYFGAWEGCGAGAGSCAGNCNHVWHYAQAYARLFPSLGRRMREQEFRAMYGGALPYRQPSVTIPASERRYPAVDGQCGSILGVYREHLLGTDDAWLRGMWPGVTQAMEFVVHTWDSDEDGVLSGLQHTTLDCKVGGSTPWLGALYVAALRACGRMAVVTGDAGHGSRYDALAARGARTQAATLFNGEYYQQVLDGNTSNWYAVHGHLSKREEHPSFRYGCNYGNGCEINQLLGQWWADQLDLGEIYPRRDERVALANLFTNNFKRSFRGEPYPLWVAEDDAGMVTCSWPKGVDEALKGRQRLGYSTCVLSGFEYAAAAQMLRLGLVREGFTVLRAISDRYDGRLRYGIHKSAWRYSGNPFGDDESGKFYARSQSAWSVLLACQGFIYDGPAGRIGFVPSWKPDDHRSLFVAAEGWGQFRQRREGAVQHSTLDVRWGRLTVRELVLGYRSGEPAAPTVTLHRGRVALKAGAAYDARTGRIVVRPAEAVTLAADATLTAAIAPGRE